MRIWKNTKTLDGLIDDLTITEDKQEADIALIGGKTIDVSEFPKLKCIFRAGISKDNLPFEEAAKRGVTVSLPSEQTSNYILEETANFTCYLILKMLYMNVGTVSQWVKNSRPALGSRNLLLIGLGRIGLMVKNKMKPFLEVTTYDSLSNSQNELKEMISKADCISLHIPNSPENKDFLDKEKLSWMKDDSVLINTARGPIVSETALYGELKNKRIYAAFDVYWKEPYEGKLKEFYPDRFFMTPHVASTCNAFLEGAAKDLRKLIIKLI
jgi:phosphoglycerate dehydrogenase-like enzyme